MATLIRYVNRSVTHTSGDGTTNGTGNGGTNSYDTLALAIAGLAQDLTAITPDVNDELGNATIAMDILCTGGQADASAVAVNQAGWVTNAAHLLRIRQNGAGNGAKWDITTNTPHYLQLQPSYGVGIINIGKAINITLQDLMVSATGTLDLGQQCVTMGNFVFNVHIVRGFYRTTGTTGAFDSTKPFESNATGAYSLFMQNVTAVAADGEVFNPSGFSSTVAACAIYNCTFVNKATNRTLFSSANINVGAVVKLRNLLLQCPTGALLNYASDGAATTSTILTQDASAPGTALDNMTVTFVDAANWDYHLSASDTSAKNAGTDLSGDATYPFSTDCDVATRSAPWDIGSDEVAGGSSATVITGLGRRMVSVIHSQG